MPIPFFRIIVGRIRLALARYNPIAKGNIIAQADCRDFSLLVPINEDVGRFIYYFGHFERRESEVFRKQVRKDDVCIDVGANVGYYTLLFSRLAYEGDIHAFEPIPFNCALINASLELNNIHNVTVNSVALGDATGQCEFFLSDDSAYSTIKAKSNAKGRVIHVRQKTLSDYVVEAGVSRINILKVDIEGAERNLLLGARETFKNALLRPRLVLLELYDPFLSQYGSSIQQVMEFMAEFSYKPYVANRSGDLVRYDKSMENKICNVFFTNG